MGWRDRRPEPRTETAVLLKRIEQLEARVRSLSQTGPTSLQLIDFEDYEDDLANVDIGEVHINWPGVHREARRYDPAVYFHDEKWRSLGSNAAVYEIKVFEDDQPNLVVNRKFVWEIPEDLDGAMVMKAGGFVTTTGGDTVVQITDDINGGNVFGSNIEIPAGTRSSKFGNSPQNTNGYPVEYGDQLAINVTSAGGNGLGVWVLVVGAGVGGILVQGAKGDPGGINNWTGAYNSGTGYSIGDAVSSGGSSYVAIAPSTGVEPGVTPGWESVWMVLSEGTRNAAVGVSAAAGNYVIAPGIKGYQPIPFDATIVGAELLADKAGSITARVYKNSFATFPTYTSAEDITNGSPLVLSGSVKLYNTSLAGWDTTVTAGDILSFEFTGASVVSRVMLSLDLER